MGSLTIISAALITIANILAQSVYQQGNLQEKLLGQKVCAFKMDISSYRSKINYVNLHSHQPWILNLNLTGTIVDTNFYSVFKVMYFFHAIHNFK